MYLRVYHFLLFADRVLGAFFSVLLFAAGMFAFSVTGGWFKTHELRTLGGAYTMFLSGIEASARELRTSYCVRADAAALAQARCGGDAMLTEASTARGTRRVTPS